MMKIIKILWCLTLTFALSGCSMLTDYRESEQVIVVSAIGFDYKDSLLKVSAETVSKAESNESIIITSAGKDIENSIKNLKKTAGVPLILSHCGATVLGQTLSTEQANEILMYLCTLYEFPSDSSVMSSGDALSLLKCKSITGEQVGYGLMRLLKENDIDSRLFVVLRNEKIALPIFKVEENNYILKDNLWTLK